MKKKTRLENFVYYDTEGITAHLEKMALEGWALEDVTRSFWTYVSIPPEKRTYGASFYPANLTFAPDAADKSEDYVAYCQQAGWQYVTQWQKMMIFYTTKEDPPPLETDEKLRLDATWEAMKRSHLAAELGMATLFFLCICQYLSSLMKHPLTHLADGTQMAQNILFALLRPTLLITSLSYLLWHRRSLAAIKAGGHCLPVGNGIRRFRRFLFPVQIAAVFWLGFGRFFPAQNAVPWFFLLAAVLYLVWKLLQKLGLPPKACVLVLLFLFVAIPRFGAMVSLSLDAGQESATVSDAPLTAADLAEIPTEETPSVFCRKSVSPFAKKLEYEQKAEGGLPALSYEIMELSMAGLGPRCLAAYEEQAETYGQTYQALSLSNADNAWQLYQGSRPLPQYLFYENDLIALLRPDEALSPEALETAAGLLLGTSSR